MKTMRNSKMILGAAVLAMSTAAVAGTTPRPVSDMECLVGVWKAKVVVTSGGQKLDGTMTWTCSRVSAQYGVLCSADASINGMGELHETDLFGWDPGTNKYHWYSVTNLGETHDHVADVSAGNAIRFAHSGTQEGKPFKEVIDMTFGKDGKTLTVRSESFSDGKSTLVFEATASKK